MTASTLSIPVADRYPALLETADDLFWGGVQNPRGGSGLVLTRDGDGFRLNGLNRRAPEFSLYR